MVTIFTPAFRPCVAITATIAGLLVLLIIVIVSLWHKFVIPLLKALNRSRGLLAGCAQQVAVI